MAEEHTILEGNVYSQRNAPNPHRQVKPDMLDANTDGYYRQGDTIDLASDDLSKLTDGQEIFQDPATGEWKVGVSTTKAKAAELQKQITDNAKKTFDLDIQQEVQRLLNQDSVNFDDKAISTLGDATEIIYSYPYDLGKTPELKNWISFEIFVSGGSNLKTNTDSKSDSNPRTFGVNPNLASTPGINPEKIASAVNSPAGFTTASLLFGVGGGALISSGMGMQTAKDLWNNFSYEGSDKVGRGEFGFVQETTGMTTANTRVPRTICLYMPSNIKTSYGVEYGEEDFTKLGTLMSTMKVTSQTLANIFKGRGVNDEYQAGMIRATMEQLGLAALKSSSDYFSQMMENVSGALGGDYNLANYFKATHRRVTNPFIINMYKSTKRRTFEFSFKFLPRNPRELESVYQIISLFKKYSLPKRIGGLAGRFVEFPAEFRIRFNHDSMENLYLPRIGRCALTDINVVYGDEVFSTFAPIRAETDKGEPVGGAAPTKIEMTVSFTELEILTADRIEQGF